MVDELPDLIGAIGVDLIVIIAFGVGQGLVAVSVIDDLCARLRRLMRVFGYAPIPVDPALGVECIAHDEITDWIIGSVGSGFAGIAKIAERGVGDKTGPGIPIFVPVDSKGCLSCVPYVRLDVVGEPVKKVISKILAPYAKLAVRQYSDGVPLLIIGDGKHVVGGVIKFDPNGVDTAEAGVGTGMVADKVEGFTAGGGGGQHEGCCQNKAGEL